MSVLKRLVAAAVLALLAVIVPACAAQSQPPPQQPSGEFIPIDQLPPEDRLPAAPLLISAYSFVMIVFFLYVVSLARRLTNVQRDVDRLGASLKQTTKP
jgi:quinol-cytochrome oxidoreductase complex cytochrome b subunit